MPQTDKTTWPYISTKAHAGDNPETSGPGEKLIPTGNTAMQIVVRQYGGIGNQLFQYAVGWFYAKKYHARLRIATEDQARSISYGHARPILLSHFAISAPVDELTKYERFFLSLRPSFELATRPARYLSRTQIFREVQPRPFTFSPEIPIERRTRRLYLVGLWQCYPPVELAQSELRREFTFRDQPRGINEEVGRRIRRTPNSVSLHMRRGDYLIHFGSELVLSEDYYLRAMAIMRDRLGEPTFFVFSDDQEFATQFASRNPDCVLVSHNKSEAAHEDLRLMSLCENHIIANSTFSWWGAWLNPRNAKAIIAPQKWLGIETESVELIPPAWIRI